MPGRDDPKQEIPRSRKEIRNPIRTPPWRPLSAELPAPAKKQQRGPAASPPRRRTGTTTPPLGNCSRGERICDSCWVARWHSPGASPFAARKYSSDMQPTGFGKSLGPFRRGSRDSLVILSAPIAQAVASTDAHLRQQAALVSSPSPRSTLVSPCHHRTATHPAPWRLSGKPHGWPQRVSDRQK